MIRFSSQELEQLHQAVDKLGVSDHPERHALWLLNQVSQKLRNQFPASSDAIRFFLELDGQNPDSYLGKVLGSRSKASEILAGKKNPSITDLRALRSNLGIPLDVLVGDQKAAPGQEIDYRQYPIAAMAKMGLIPANTTKRSRNLEKTIKDFFQEAGFSPENAKAACFRRSSRKNEKSDNFALQAWLASIRSQSLKKGTPDYTGITREDLDAIAKLSVHSDGPLRAVDFLHQKGVAVVVMPHFRGTYLDGSVFLLHGKPVIGLTLRYDRVDHFWHTLMHELCHLVLGHVSDVPVFDDLEIAALDDVEQQADQTAQSIFISDTKWKEFRSHRVSTMSICALAAHLSISPAIVAGRYRFEKKNYKLFTGLVGHGEVRRLFPEFQGAR